VNHVQTTRPDPVTDADVFREIYARARRFAAFVAPAGTEPDDLVQDAVARVLAGRPLATIEEPLAYVRATMLNLVRNEHRRRTRERRAVDRLPGAATAPDDVGRVDDLAAVLDVLRDLPPAARALVFLVDVEGYATGEAAALVGSSGPAARARLSRSRRAIRRRLDAPSEQS
jgi:RNA polymerase sigma-70 factor (ECF subfamily)